VNVMPLITLTTAILAAHSSWCWGQASDNDSELAIGLIAYAEPSIYQGGSHNEGLLTYAGSQVARYYVGVEEVTVTKKLATISFTCTLSALTLMPSPGTLSRFASRAAQSTIHSAFLLRR
jgi:hypothetical protein